MNLWKAFKKWQHKKLIIINYFYMYPPAMNNPIVRLQYTEKVLYPIMVRCVVDDLSEINTEILKIREYVHSLNLIFTMRMFNSFKYSDDRNNIRQLPAFHIYEKGGYRNTFYLNTHPYQIIHDTLENYKQSLAIREVNKQAWRKFFSNIMLSLKNLTKKKETRTHVRILDWP